VCRHWIKGRCARAEDCADLHIWDLDRMPDCMWGSECPGATCFYRHIAEEDKEECFNYRLGFCFEGRLCKQRHIPKTDLPEVSELWLPGNPMLARSQGLPSASPSVSPGLMSTASQSIRGAVRG
jgi:hypothetical protein